MTAVAKSEHPFVALPSPRCSPEKRPVADGKPKKVAQVGAMRKRLATLNAMLGDDYAWKYPTPQH